MLLFVVRRGESGMYRYLRQTFAEHPVVITWDRRVGERRHPRRPIPGDWRSGERRDAASPLSLKRLPFIALTVPDVPDRQAS